MTDRDTCRPAKLVISGCRVQIVFVEFALAAAVYTVARPAKTAAQALALPFESVQTDLFSVPNSYSNAWADFDNDGDLDLAVSLGSGEVRLYRNDNGTLVSVGKEMGLPQAGGGSYELRGLSWGDFDGDGFVDLLGGATQTGHVTKVFHNLGGRRFVDVAADLGLTIPGRSARQTSWVDYDNDGDLDVYAADRQGKNKLFRNEGGTFTQVFADGGPTVFRSTVGACWFDMDGDGDLDLFLADQSGAPDAVFRNDGNAFIDVAPQLGMTGPPRTKDEGGVGCAVGDYDNDGRLDLFVANYGHNQLYHNNGDGTFTDVAKQLGVDVENHAVSADWGDYDNDGYLDLMVIAYAGPVTQQQPANAFFHNEGGKRFVNVLTQESALNVADHGVQWVDYNNDGRLDLSVTRGYTTKGGHFLFRNTLSESVKRRSLEVTVLDSKGHWTRFGAEVRLYDASGQVLGTHLVSTGGGYNSQSAIPLHFGLAKREPVTVEVTFMTKQGRTKQTIRNVNPANFYGKTLVIREAQ
jgi:FG-GAP-like repeat/ASPIC and UnbV